MTSVQQAADGGRLLRPISVTELFTIGIGPSSSHTVGPMRAAADFATMIDRMGVAISRIECALYGSLALTGLGHATDMAIVLGLAGHHPETVDPDAVGGLLDDIRRQGTLALAGARPMPFVEGRDLLFHKQAFLPEHPNGMMFSAWLDGGRRISETYYSIGGGVIVGGSQAAPANLLQVAHPFSSAAELIAIGDAHGLRIGDIVRHNEAAWRDRDETDGFLDQVRGAMASCIDRGMAKDGILPGGLGVKRRAHALHAHLQARGPRADPSVVFEWVSLWALAVNEENAAGGRVVTAPTNGAAGVIPAVLRYYDVFTQGATAEGAREFLYAASAIGFLYKKRASISAAEMGCQGEVGVACSMAAAGLAAALGGTNRQIENAAEIGMEHNLGLTCDPVGGLVQIPCIERNTMGAVKAINAAYLALRGDGDHRVSLDAVIETMRQTGEDMRSQYKETSLGGLAVNVVEC